MTPGPSMLSEETASSSSMKDPTFLSHSMASFIQLYYGTIHAR